MFFLLKLACIMVIIKYVESVPKARHEHKYETELQNHSFKDAHKQINLEFLEKKLLKRPFTNRRHRHFLKQYNNETNFQIGIMMNDDTMTPGYEKDMLRRKRTNKPRKTFKRSFGTWNLKNSKQQAQPEVEDFFGLLQNKGFTSTVGLVGDLYHNNVAATPYSNSSLTTSNNVSLDSSSSIKLNSSKKVARKIILPGTRIKLENSELYLKSAEDTPNEIGTVLSSVTEEQVNELSENAVNTTETIVNTETTEVTLTYDESKSKGSERQKCESENGKKCVCSIVNVKSNLNDIFVRANTQTQALEKVKAFSCQEFSPIPDRFEINSHTTPKTFDKDKKPITVNQETGPKEIDKSTLSDFISQITSSSVEDDEIEVFPGADVFLPCFPTKNIHLPSNNEDDVTYKWAHTKDKPITEGNIKPNADGEGTLFIDEAVFANSDNYTCTVEYINPDTGQRRQEEFLHTISVVTLPIVSVHVFMSYKTASCDKSTTENFRKYLPHQMEETVCNLSLGKHLCAVEIHNAVCLDSTGNNKERSKRYPREIQYQSWWNREKRESSKELSLNYEVYIHKHEEHSLSAANASLCDPNCHLLTIFKMVQLLRENIDAVIQVPVYSEMDNKADTFNPMSSSVKVKYIFGCHDGNHHIGNGFCGACPKNTFSKNGTIVCKKCPPHSYQGNIASSECIFCKKRWIPYCNEFVEDYNIYMILVVVIALVILISFIFTCYMMHVKNKTMADMVSSFIHKEEKHKKNVKFGKSFRSPRTARTQIKKELPAELKAIIDTSGAETSDFESDVDQEETLPEERLISKSKRRRARKKRLFQAHQNMDNA